MRKRPKHERTYGYFFIARQFDKSIMRDDAFNLHIYRLIMKIYLTRLLLGLEQIKMDHCGQKIISSLFYGREQIRKR